MGTCYVCKKQTPWKDKYCARCLAFIKHKREKLKRRAAMRSAYDRDADAFRCSWTGVILEERDHEDPFFLCFDHYRPVRSSRLDVASVLTNQLKAAFSPSEFPHAIAELARHHAGEPFDRDFIDFTDWNLRAPRPPGWRVGGEGVVDVASPGCRICGRPTAKRFHYCPRCRLFVQHGDLRAKATGEAWGRGGSGAVAPGRSWTTPGAPGPSRSTTASLWTPGSSSSPRGGSTKTALGEESFGRWSGSTRGI